MWVPFAKGHGTRNDFVIFPDFDATLELSPEQVQAICDRRAGIGGDGVLRVVPAAKDADSVQYADAAEWFMDYRNSDGSLAQMCGNGTRVFAHYLVTEGLVEPGLIPIATRGGVKRVWVHPLSSRETGAVGSATTELSMPQLGAATEVQIGGVTLPATAVNVGNPHAVCVVTTPLNQFDLSIPPRYDAAIFPEGVNIELITPPRAADSAPASACETAWTVRMRVHERGSGETYSCGSGAVAAAAVALRTAQVETASHIDPRRLPSGIVSVELPGGQLRVELTESTALLTGAAVIVAKGECLLMGAGC
ncbi:MAG: diaminopimelate epimerase [Acidimicrobiales bacterium]|nr:MAG: diaminopimelate epimerase [Acidimicrobiales bacterium]